MAQRTPDPSKTATGKCPICGEPTEYESRPFCSRRCANIDLYRWMSGGYAIAGRADTDEDGIEDLLTCADGTVARRNVTLGPLVSGLRVVREGIAGGDWVITRGLQRARPGIKVTMKEVAISLSETPGAKSQQE